MALSASDLEQINSAIESQFGERFNAITGRLSALEEGESNDDTDLEGDDGPGDDADSSDADADADTDTECDDGPAAAEDLNSDERKELEEFRSEKAKKDRKAEDDRVAEIARLAAREEMSKNANRVEPQEPADPNATGKSKGKVKQLSAREDWVKRFEAETGHSYAEVTCRPSQRTAEAKFGGQMALRTFIHKNGSIPAQG